MDLNQKLQQICNQSGFKEDGDEVTTYDSIKELIEALTLLEEKERTYKITLTKTIVSYTEVTCTRKDAERLAKVCQETDKDKLEKDISSKNEVKIEIINQDFIRSYKKQVSKKTNTIN